MGLLWGVKMRGWQVGLIALGGVLVCLAVTPAGAEDKAPPKEGEALYKKYCASCHGDSGKGDGVLSGFMNPHPSNLTQIAKRHGGKFSDIQVMNFISGKNMPKVHGRGDMPVWGEVFEQPSSDVVTSRAGVQSKLLAITEYLRSIQEK